MQGREINKYIKQNCANSLTCLRDYTGMHGQQNIKLDTVVCRLVRNSGSLNLLEPARSVQVYIRTALHLLSKCVEGNCVSFCSWRYYTIHLLKYRAAERCADLQPNEVKDLIKQHSKKMAVADAKELNIEDNSKDSDTGTKCDPNCQSLEETMEKQPPLVVWWNMVR